MKQQVFSKQQSVQSMGFQMHVYWCFVSPYQDIWCTASPDESNKALESYISRGFKEWKAHNVNVVHCLLDTVWLGCQWTTRSRIYPVQMWPICYWRTSSSGLTMRSKWRLTMGRVWARSATKSPNGLCREVSTHIFNIIDPRTKLIWLFFPFWINECAISSESAFMFCFKQASLSFPTDNSS